MISDFAESPSPLTLVQQEQRKKYGMKNYQGDRNRHEINKDGVGGINGNGYNSMSYDDMMDMNSKKLLLQKDKNFWRIEYNFTSLYRTQGISAESLDDLSHKLQTNRSWFDIYLQTNNVNLKSGKEDPSKICADVDCRRVQNCAISHVDYAEYQYCVERGEGFGDNEIVGLAYDVTSSGGGGVNTLNMRNCFPTFIKTLIIFTNMKIVYLSVLTHLVVCLYLI